VSVRFCDERGASGFSWVVDEPATRASHALVADGEVWLVDPVAWAPALERAAAAGRVAAVLQLLDRHNRDCASVAASLGVPHLVTPETLPSSPFRTIAITGTRVWREVALWHPAQATLVVPEAIGTNAFYTGGRGDAGVHVLLRLRPPRRQLGGLAPRHLHVGHGVGLHGDAAATALADALRTARSGLVHVVPRIPALVLDARRRRAAPAPGDSEAG
jgi:hypothetical protein